MLYDRYFESTSGEGFQLQGELRHAKRVFRAFYAPLIPAGTAARILDVGCGFGKMLWAARECGFTAIEGVDISDDQVAFGRSALGLTLCKGDAVEKLMSLRQELDAVLVIDVLEHCELDYSIALLRAAGAALKPGGVLIAQVPNGLSPLSPTFHGDATHVRAFSVTSLGQLFRFGGFKSFSFRGMPPVVHGPASALRNFLWKVMLHPLISAYMLVTCGDAMGGVYTPNIIGCARNDG
jgi:SAM-dependent methyltransferase